MIKYIASLLVLLGLSTQLRAQTDSITVEQFNKIQLKYGGAHPTYYD